MRVAFVPVIVCGCAQAPATGQSEADQTGATAAPLVAPGKGIGPIRMGMTEAEVEATKLPVEKTQSGMWHVGPYRVLFEDGQVISVDAKLRELGGAVLGGTTLGPEEQSLDRFAANLTGCGKVETRGHQVVCGDGTATIIVGSPQGGVEVEVISQDYAKRIAAKQRRAK
jgi:hypothetical protein